MNELKPEDVMMALEQMASKANCNYMRHLEGCGYFCIRLGKNVDDMAKGRSPECNENCEHFSPPYIEKVLRSALALLREKDATIDALIRDRHAALRLSREKDAEIERLTAYNANLICANTDITNRHKDYVEDAERIARADAITEFAERLKTFYKHLPGNTVGGAVEYHIDQIAKEMKGVKDDIKKSQEAT